MRYTENGDIIWCEQCGETPAEHFDGYAVLCHECKIQLKVCVKCNQIKPVSAFGTDQTHKDGLQSWCRLCKAAWARRYYATDKGKLAHNRNRRNKVV